MGIAGPVASYLVYKGFKKSGFSQGIVVFLAAALGDLITYCVTSLQLAIAFPDPTGGLIISLQKFLGIFAVTQVPLAISEGLMTVIVFNILVKYNRETLNILEV